MPAKTSGRATVAVVQFDLLARHPYRHTSEAVIFVSSPDGRDLIDEIGAPDFRNALDRYFSVRRACLRASPLPRRYVWGVHFDAAARAAIYTVESDEYGSLRDDSSLQQLVAFRSRRATRDETAS